MAVHNVNNGDTLFTNSPRINDSIFSSINEIENTLQGGARESMAWLRNNATSMVNQKKNLIENYKDKLPEDIDKSFMSNRMNSKSIGRMFMYLYDPKFKKTLPYYDALPLIILVDFTDNGFRGLNLHYVPPFYRKRILEALFKNMNNKALSNKTKANMSYNILKKISLFEIMKPCFKRYLFSNVRSSFMYVDPTEWDKAIMLPTEQFKKKTKTQIYADTINASLGSTTKPATVKESENVVSKSIETIKSFVAGNKLGDKE